MRKIEEIKTYKVTDLCCFYEVPANSMFLIMSSNNKTEDDSVKIRICPRHFLKLNYGRTEIVSIIIKNEKTSKFEIVDIPVKNNVCNIYDAILNKGIQLVYGLVSRWRALKEEALSDWNMITVSEDTIVIHYNNKSYALIPNKPIKIDGMNTVLHKATICESKSWDECIVVSKCLYNKRLTVSDFFELIDDDSDTARIYLDFGNIEIEFIETMIYVMKKLEEYEMVTFSFAKKRIVFLSMFFKFVLKSESENCLVKGIDEFFICSKNCKYEDNQ